MNDIVTFRRMVTPIVIQVVWWLGNLVTVIMGFFGSVFELGDAIGGWSVLLGIVGVVVLLIFWRCLCELVMIIFRINETLSVIRRDLRKSQ